MSIAVYPLFSSPVVLFETDQEGEYMGVFEGNKVVVKSNTDYSNNTKYSVFFLNMCIGLDDLPEYWEIDYQ